MAKNKWLNEYIIKAYAQQALYHQVKASDVTALIKDANDAWNSKDYLADPSQKHSNIAFLNYVSSGFRFPGSSKPFQVLRAYDAYIHQQEQEQEQEKTKFARASSLLRDAQARQQRVSFFTKLGLTSASGTIAPSGIQDTRFTTRIPDYGPTPDISPKHVVKPSFAIPYKAYWKDTAPIAEILTQEQNSKVKYDTRPIVTVPNKPSVSFAIGSGSSEEIKWFEIEEERKYKERLQNAKTPPNPKDASKARLQALRDLTSVNMHGFFPAYSGQGSYSKVILGEDTETDDRFAPIEYAGLKLLFNFDKLQFEQLPDAKSSELVQIYTSASNSLNKTTGIHGYTQSLLKYLAWFQKLHTNSRQSLSWNSSEYQSILDWAGEDVIHLGHNWLNADRNWMAGHKSGALKHENISESFLDTLHLAEAINGKAKINPYTGESDRRNALQVLARKYKVDAESLGLQAHKGYNDVIVLFKVLEKMIQQHRNHPAVKEFLAGMKYGGVQSKRWSAPSEGYGARFEHHGFVLTGLRGGHLMSDVMDEIINEAAQQTKLGYEDIHNEEGELEGYQIVDPEAPEPSDTKWKSPQKIIEERHIVHDSMGSGRLASIDMAKTLFKHGASETEVKQYLQRFFRGTDVILEKGGLEDVIAASRMMSGIQDKEAEFRTIADTRRKRIYAEYLAKDSQGLYDSSIRRFGAYSSAKAAEIARISTPRFPDELRLNNYDKYLQDIESYKEIAAMDTVHPKTRAIANAKARMLQANIEGFERAQTARELESLRLTADSSRLSGYYNQSNDIIEGKQRDFAEEQQRLQAMAATTDEDLQAYKDWGTSANPTHRDYWDFMSASDDNARLARHRDEFSSQLELDMNHRYNNIPKGQMAMAKGYITGLDLHKLSKVTQSTEDYGKALDKMIVRNRRILDVTQRLNSIPMYNPLQLLSAVDNQYSGIRGAAQGILPGFMANPILRAGDAMANMWHSQEAEWKYQYNMSKMGITAAGTLAGSLLGLTPLGPLGVMLGANLGGAAAGALSQIWGQNKEKEITQFGEGVQHRLNLIGSVTTLLGGFANGLRMAIGLFGKLGRLWDYMPSHTMRTLTGVQWKSAAPLAASDRLLGLQSGSLNNQYTKLALGQGNLYGSGRFDEKSLTAAARLGMFDLVYAAPGGDTQAQMDAMYDRMYRKLYESGADKATQQMDLALLNDVSPELVAALEVGHGMVQAGKKEYRNYSYFRSMRGYGSLTDTQIADVKDTATRWDRAKESFTQGIGLAGTRVYDFFDRLLIQPLNKWLFDAANTGKVDWKGLGTILSDAWDESLGQIDWSTFDWKEKLKFLDGLISAVEEKLKPLAQVFTNIAYDTIQELRLFKIDFDFAGFIKDLATPGKSPVIGDYMKVSTPSKVRQQLVAEAENTAKLYEAFKDPAFLLNTDKSMLAYKSNFDIEMSVGPQGLNKIGYDTIDSKQQIWQRVTSAMNTKAAEFKGDFTQEDINKSKAKIIGLVNGFADVTDENSLFAGHGLFGKTVSSMVDAYKGDVLTQAGIQEFVADYVAMKTGDMKGLSEFVNTQKELITELANTFKMTAQDFTSLIRQRQAVLINISDNTQSNTLINTTNSMQGGN